ncbi:DUF7511 domain-containing protein [Natronobiforma cellulositropha]|uniref:DUF7511 domain-containing protein n=1 Tax=Natronobiforma cellulositropha TaxID=1679076 RepID=UPI0021D56E66|nr:hypothetical protein [Natronobiforma cellulositropha]
MTTIPTDPTDGTPAEYESDTGAEFELESIVVRYETRADRCTVYPRERSEAEVLTAWLTADVDAFVLLEEMW